VITDTELTVLRAIDGDLYPNARTEGARCAEQGFNLVVPSLFARGFIVQSPARRTAYKLSRAGRKALDERRAALHADPYAAHAWLCHDGGACADGCGEHADAARLAFYNEEASR
jgi:hypothetical protein